MLLRMVSVANCFCSPLHLPDHDHIDIIIRQDEPARSRFGCNLRRDGAHPGRKLCRHEALALADQFGFADRLARENLQADR